MMTESDFLALLNSMDFPRLYWEMCDRFPVRPGTDKQGRKEDVVAAFREIGIDARYDRQTFTIEEEKIGDFVWCGVFVKQWNGLDLRFEGAAGKQSLGSNFAVLAYDAKKLADPAFERDRFSGPPPYPRPGHNGDSVALRGIVREFVRLVRLIKDKLRTQVRD
jgi:hypothetical protein